NFDLYVCSRVDRAVAPRVGTGKGIRGARADVCRRIVPARTEVHLEKSVPIGIDAPGGKVGYGNLELYVLVDVSALIAVKRRKVGRHGEDRAIASRRCEGIGPEVEGYIVFAMTRSHDVHFSVKAERVAGQGASLSERLDGNRLGRNVRARARKRF